MIAKTKRTMVMMMMLMIMRTHIPSHERYRLLVFGTARVLQVPELDMPGSIIVKYKVPNPTKFNLACFQR